MIVEELAYKVTVKAEEFLAGKRKVSQETKEWVQEVHQASDKVNENFDKMSDGVTTFGKAGKNAFSQVNDGFSKLLGLTTRFVAVGGVMTAMAIGIHKVFESSAESIVNASNIGRILGTGASNVLGTQYGFSRIGQNGGAFLGAQMNAKMALANLQDPTIFGGLTGEAQNLLTLGARTGIDINKLGGSSTSALKEFQKYGKGHTKDQLMQVLAGFGFDPNLAGDIKSGKAVQMVSEEEKRWKMTKEQEEAQRKILETTRALDSQFAQVKQELMATFGPEVLKAEQEFLAWLKDNKGDIVGFFNNMGKSIDGFVKAVGGAGNALGILAAAALISGKATGGIAAIGILGQLVQEQYKDVPDEQRPFIFRQHWMDRFLGIDYDDPNKSAPTNPGGKNRPDRNNNPLNLKATGSRRRDKDGFAQFFTPEEGWKAARDQLSLYYTRDKLGTVQEIISKWAPSSENDTKSYIAQVSKSLGVRPNEKLNLSDPAVMAGLSAYMAKHEGYPNWRSGLDYGSDAKSSAAGYYQTQQRLAAGAGMSTPSQNVVNNYNSQHINEVKVQATTDQASRLAEGFKEMHSRASTNQAFSSAVPY
ncbi:hypothetical protein [Edwardsiella piscicida]|uniref:hypothetical protein n=1 Tax=Edwardsiella piscicida TaxID=1263550 RepID=UPI0024795C27|nr:hypothetical protein [Edwardsiella piscicida]WGS75544.1 hypothetical protein PED68_09195 [Edwardsiella piscicida]WGS78933.1 hypothetical protein PED70_09200 [Edwardsiella piscicida]